MLKMASIIWVPLLFVAASFLLYMIALQSPPLYNHNNSTFGPVPGLRFPRTLEDLSGLVLVLRQYRSSHLHYLMLLYCCAYIYKQTFAIPGSVLMNILAGAVFGTRYAFPLVCFLTATGATFCFLLSRGFGKYYVLKYLPDKVEFLQRKVAENSDGLFFFLLFVRLFPMSPNWLLNVVSPILNIPIHLFFLSVLLGLMPYNFICVETGVMLSEITSMDDIFSSFTLAKLASLACITLVPGLWLRRYRTSSTADGR